MCKKGNVIFMNNLRRPSIEEEKRHKEWKKNMKKIIMDDPDLSMLEKLKKVSELDFIEKTVKY